MINIFDSVGDLLTHPAPGSRSVALVLGYHQSSDGGGGIFTWESASTATPNGGTTLIPTGHSGAGRWVRMHDGQLSVRWFGARGDGSSDDLPAFLQAIEAMGPPNETTGGLLFVPPGVYRLAGDLLINRKMIVRGAGGTGWFYNSQLLFDDGHGVVIDGFKSSINPDPRRGDQSVLQYLSIVSAGSNLALAERATRPDGTYADGVYMKTRAHLEHCAIVRFAGHGIHIWGYDNGKDDLQNCNDWTVTRCYVENCAGWGMYVHGSDSNAGVGIHIECITNGQGGIWDSSFLGNTYVGCHIEGNLYPATPGVAYRIDSYRTTLIGCYSENDLQPSHLGGQAISIGGNHGAQSGSVGSIPGFSPASTGLILGAADEVSPHVVYSKGTKAGANWERLHVGVQNGSAVFGWQAADDQAEFSLSYNYIEQGWWELHRGTARFLAVSGGNAPEGPGKLAFPDGYYLGYSTNKRRVHNGSGPPGPGDGAFRQGDQIYNRDPQPGGYVGWVCVQDGSPGIWKGFGLIET